MNREAVKSLLERLKPEAPSFDLIFSGKTSRKVDGLYKPDTREIIIHNKNMDDDHALIYTAIHEFAHHLQFTGPNRPSSSRSHTTAFWNILHELLGRAERMGIYDNPFAKDTEFEELTKRIKDEYLRPNGALMKELGGLLNTAMELCRKKHASFDDYLDRVLGLHRNLGKTLVRMHRYDLDPAIGYENMKTVASIAAPDRRRIAEETFRSGASPDTVRTRLKELPVTGGERKRELPELERLTLERSRVEKTLKTLQTRLEDLDKRILTLKDKGRAALETSD